MAHKRDNTQKPKMKKRGSLGIMERSGFHCELWEEVKFNYSEDSKVGSKLITLK